MARRWICPRPPRSLTHRSCGSPHWPSMPHSGCSNVSASRRSSIGIRSSRNAFMMRWWLAGRTSPLASREPLHDSLRSRRRHRRGHGAPARRECGRLGPRGPGSAVRAFLQPGRRHRPRDRPDRRRLARALVSRGPTSSASADQATSFRSRRAKRPSPDRSSVQGRSFEGSSGGFRPLAP